MTFLEKKFSSLLRQQGHGNKSRGIKQRYVCHLPCAWCAFTFLCAFIPSDLLKNPHVIFVYPLSRTLSSRKRSGLFLLLQSKSSTIIHSPLFLDPISFPLCALFAWSLLSLCLLPNSSLTSSNALLSLPFYLLAGAMELTLNESSDRGKKRI